MLEFLRREKPQLSRKETIAQMRTSLDETLGQKIRDLHKKHLEIRTTIAEINRVKADKASQDSLYRGASTKELEEVLKDLHQQISKADGEHLKFWAETRARRKREDSSTDY